MFKCDRHVELLSLHTAEKRLYMRSLVSALVSGSCGLGSSPCRGTALCSSVRHLTLAVPLLTQVYKKVPVN